MEKEMSVKKRKFGKRGGGKICRHFVIHIILMFPTKGSILFYIYICTFSAPYVFHLPLYLGNLSISLYKYSSISLSLKLSSWCNLKRIHFYQL